MSAQRALAAIVMVLLTSFYLAAQDSLKVEVKAARESDFVSSSAVVVTFSANLILPDGAHAKVSCVSGVNECGAIESFHPERLKPDSRKCTNHVQDNALWKNCIVSDLGVFEATREGNDLIIVVPSGTVRYHIDGSWQ